MAQVFTMWNIFATNDKFVCVCADTLRSKLTRTQQSENKVAGQSELLADAILEDKFADVCPVSLRCKIA